MQRQQNGPFYSFWEMQTYFNKPDLVVIGSGIVGLNAAIHFKEIQPKARVLVLERGIIPSGASTKNAGFACFGSVSELLYDLSRNPADLVWQTVEMRLRGLELLRKRLGDQNIDYQQHGGYELFDDSRKLSACMDGMHQLNRQLASFFGGRNVYRLANDQVANFGFKGVEGLILNEKEGQIDTGKMMDGLIRLAVSKGIHILNSVALHHFEEQTQGIELMTSAGDFKAGSLIVATNGFANQLLDLPDVKPARAQVLITGPIPNLRINGTFHYDEGFYYFRNIGQRLLFGGGRNLDMETEATSEMALNPMIQDRLDELLTNMILPGTAFRVEQRWSGIMGVGNEKKPVIRKISPHVVCSVRMGGMGVAIGSLVGKLAVERLVES